MGGFILCIVLKVLFSLSAWRWSFVLRRVETGLQKKKEQEDWDKYLKAMKHRNKGRLIFLQDMSPSSFKGKALSEMKRKSDPGIDPLLLIDPKGEMRRKLGVEKEDTIVLVYDKKGRASCGFRVFNK